MCRMRHGACQPADGMESDRANAWNGRRMVDTLRCQPADTMCFARLQAPTTRIQGQLSFGRPATAPVTRHGGFDAVCAGSTSVEPEALTRYVLDDISGSKGLAVRRTAKP